MSRRRVRRTLGAAILSLLACGDNTASSVSPNDFADGLVATVNDVSDPAWPRDAVTIDSARTSRDTLELFVHYGGGCRTHRFALLLGSAFMESHPVQVHARLAHDADGDACKAWLAQTLLFDLGSLKSRYRASYGPGPATIVISFIGHSLSVRYAFD